MNCDDPIADGDVHVISFGTGNRRELDGDERRLLRDVTEVLDIGKGRGRHSTGNEVKYDPVGGRLLSDMLYRFKILKIR